MSYERGLSRKNFSQAGRNLNFSAASPDPIARRLTRAVPLGCCSPILCGEPSAEHTVS